MIKGNCHHTAEREKSWKDRNRVGKRKIMRKSHRRITFDNT